MNKAIRNRVTELTIKKLQLESDIKEIKSDQENNKNNKYMTKYLNEDLSARKNKFDKISSLLDWNMSVLLHSDDEYEIQLEN